MDPNGDNLNDNGIGSTPAVTIPANRGAGGKFVGNRAAATKPSGRAGGTATNTSKRRTSTSAGTANSGTRKGAARRDNAGSGKPTSGPGPANRPGGLFAGLGLDSGLLSAGNAGGEPKADGVAVDPLGVVRQGSELLAEGVEGALFGLGRILADMNLMAARLRLPDVEIDTGSGIIKPADIWYLSDGEVRSITDSAAKLVPNMPENLQDHLERYLPWVAFGSAFIMVMGGRMQKERQIVAAIRVHLAGGPGDAGAAGGSSKQGAPGNSSNVPKSPGTNSGGGYEPTVESSVSGAASVIGSAGFNPFG